MQLNLLAQVPIAGRVICTSSDCGSGLHCFRQTRAMRSAGISGPCRSCGAELVDWHRIAKHDLRDVGYTFEALRKEMFRHYFWHLPLDVRAVNYALRKGKEGLLDATIRRIRSSVAMAEPFRDGLQTPRHGNPLYYGQHATATCCRHCIEEWHGVPQHTPLDEDTIRYFAELVERYVLDRIPDLPESPMKVPPIRKARP